MGRLSELVADPRRSPALLADVEALLESEVAERRGLSGIAVRGSWALVRAVKPNLVSEALAGLLPRFAEVLDPIVDACPPSVSLTDHLTRHRSEIVAALLHVTDERAQRSAHPVLVKAYERLREGAERQVDSSVPRLVPLIARHAVTPVRGRPEPATV